VLDAIALKTHAEAIGFDLCGIAAALRFPRLNRLESWIAQGRAGDMQYLTDSLGERLDVRQLLPTARSVIVLGSVYNTGPASSHAPADQVAQIARYAWGDDYHDVLKGRVRELLGWMVTQTGPGLEAISSVDSGPVQERVFAEQAGLGWIGKNTCLINDRLGSWMFLAVIVTNAELPADVPGDELCGSCTRCLDACPTGAFVEPWTLDATRCLSYLTIERRAPVDPVLGASIGTRVFGCDICQEVCPWNRRAAVTGDPSWQPRPELQSPTLLGLCELTDESMSRLLRGSALRRAGLRRLRRSLAFAAPHLPAPLAARALQALQAHPSSAHEDVRAALAWAWAEITPDASGEAVSTS
jgi:epoxyqueuosine reductase